MTDEVHYVLLQTKSGDEVRAQSNLEAQGYLTALPQIKSSRGKLSALFPGYIFVRESELNLRAINSTRGVVRVVAFDGIPAKLNEEQVDTLMALGERHNDVDKVCPGSTVRILDGPFALLEGIVKDRNGIDRVVVLLELMGRIHKLQFKGKELQLVV